MVFITLLSWVLPGWHNVTLWPSLTAAVPKTTSYPRPHTSPTRGSKQHQPVCVSVCRWTEKSFVFCRVIYTGAGKKIIKWVQPDLVVYTRSWCILITTVIGAESTSYVDATGTDTKAHTLLCCSKMLWSQKRWITSIMTREKKISVEKKCIKMSQKKKDLNDFKEAI